MTEAAAEEVTPALAHPWHQAPTHQGSALVRGARNEALYIADEDHARLVVAPLPLGSKPLVTFDLPGRPAQVLALEDRLLVTIRDPGLLLSIPLGEDQALRIAQRVSLPDDAWGLAVDSEEDTAFVTSGWTHRFTGVDLADGEVLFEVDVAREPRGIAIMPDGRTAYVTHLMGPEITRIDGIDSPSPAVRRVELPAGRLSVSLDREPLDATLAYAPVLSPDASRLFVPRHVLGGLGWSPWFGRPTVDVLSTRDDTPLAPERTNKGLKAEQHLRDLNTLEDEGESLSLPLLYTVQPRATVFRSSTHTILVASEGHGRITELDARATDPSVHPVYRYELTHDAKEAERCGAPSGIALSADETTAFVWCRTTNEIAVTPLKASFAAGPDGYPDRPSYVSVASTPLAEPAETGRRLYFDARNDDARNAGVSGGLGCAGCHPDGRDDGHVWLESSAGGFFAGKLRRKFFMSQVQLEPFVGTPRQTPMLAGRVTPEGPYGWRAKEKSLEQRVLKGFTVHRWFGSDALAKNPEFIANHEEQARSLAAFLRTGLVPPPVAHRPLSDLEVRGKELFDGDASCAGCHTPATDFTNRAVFDLKMGQARLEPTIKESNEYRVPSLLGVAGTPPYLHDGRYATLEDLVADLDDEMGTTSDLQPADLQALTAYLRTIGQLDSGPTQSSPPVERLPFPPRSERIPASSFSFEDPSGLVKAPPAEATSSSPSRQEWDAAPALVIAHMPDDCRAWQVREWVRIQCLPAHGHVQRVALVAGQQEGVRLTHEYRSGYEAEGVVVFPVRRGDNRFFEIDRVVITGVWCSKYTDWFQAGTFTISESWPVADAAPSLVVTRYGRHRSTGPLILHQRCG